MDSKTIFFKFFLFSTVLYLGNISLTYAQISNSVLFAMGMLEVPTDAQAGGMGEMGIAIGNPNSAMHFNASRLAFAEQKMGASVSFMPLSHPLSMYGVRKYHVFYANTYKQFKGNQAIGLSLRRFNLGITQYSVFPEAVKAHEMEVAATYSRKLSERFALGITMKYVYSKIGEGVSNQGIIVHPGKALAGDFSLTYQQPLTINDRGAKLTAGLVVNNMGSKVAYTSSSAGGNLPATLGLGVGLEYPISDRQKISIGMDVKRFLIATNPKDGQSLQDFLEQSSLASAWNSFTDAPDGIGEELRENICAIGVEYQYGFLAGRVGYGYAHKSKFNRHFVSTGLGVDFKGVGVDFSYKWDIKESESSFPWRLSAMINI